MSETDKKRAVLGILAALAAIVVLGVGILPAYRAVTAWRARNLAAQSDSLRAKGKLPEAQLKAQAAYLIRPDEPEALRAAARIQTDLREPNSTGFWQALIALGKASPEDRREYVELCLRNSLLPQAEAELQKLMAEAPNASANLWLLSQMRLAKGDVAHSIEFATQARDKDPANERYQLFVGSIQFDSPDGATRDSSRRTVWRIAREPDPLSLDAIAFLAKRSQLTPDQLRDLIQILDKHPLAKTPQQLLALGLEIRLEPERKADLLKQASAKFRAGPAEDLDSFAAWLNGQIEFDQTLASLPLEQALKRRVSFILHMDALGGLGRWQAVQRILDTPDLPLSRTVVQAFRARTALQLKRPEDATLAWRRALNAAQDDPEELVFLAQYAEKNNEFDYSARAFHALAKVAANPLPVYLTLSQLLQQHGSTEDLRDVLNEMADKWPRNSAFKNDAAYLNLLLEKDLVRSKQTAEQLVRENPQFLSMRSTLALAYLRLKDPAAALNVYSDANYDWRQALPANAAVYVAVLAANGKTNDAGALALTLPIESLRKEERELTAIW